MRSTSFESAAQTGGVLIFDTAFMKRVFVGRKE